ncbi:MAG: adenylate/guanylate cyclase domain-containing protein, partial [Methylococcaceae bacterium]|nr:adenylate/guanylate cyclase domain-containing protein [Methylococcaceae bacterium]
PSTVNQFWLFAGGDPNQPSFPVISFTAYFLKHAYREFLMALRRVDPELAANLPADSRDLLTNEAMHDFLARFRRLALEDPGFSKQRDEILNTPAIGDHRALIASWLKFLYDADSIHFNHYGPPGAIPTISVSQLLGGAGNEAFDFSGKVVFVGFADDLQPQKTLGFYTFFSKPQNLTISTVELAATAFANLYENSKLKVFPLGFHWVILLAWAVLIVTWLTNQRIRYGIMASLLFSGAYFALVFLAFTSNLWIPYCTVLFVQTPFAAFCSIWWRYAVSHHEREEIYRAFSYYVPEKMVDKMIEKGVVPGSGIAFEIPRGACLFADAGQYTKLAESLDPMSLGELMNRYYGGLFPLVKRHGGLVSDVVGDAMLAIWADERDFSGVVQSVCRCALSVQAEVERFNREHAIKLPIRIGIHSGSFRLGNVGSDEHYEYRAIGDTVNTASRIENLNKKLGTRILVTGEMITQTGLFLTRELGSFLLEGKSRAVLIHELLCGMEDATEQRRRLCAEFAGGLKRYRLGAYGEAEEVFEGILGFYPSDGPSRFYADLCRQQRGHCAVAMNPQPIRIGKD